METQTCQNCKVDRPSVLFSRKTGPLVGWCEACVSSIKTKPCKGCGCTIPQKRGLYCSPLCQIRSHCVGIDNPNGCWVWQGAKRENGYGLVRVMTAGGPILRSAARAAYAAHHGAIPEGASVLQTCGTKNCCNPAHLRLRTQELQLHTAA